MKGAKFSNSFDKPEDIFRCLTCQREECAGECPPQAVIDGIPEAFIEDLKAGLSITALAKKHHRGHGTVEKWTQAVVNAGWV